MLSSITGIILSAGLSERMNSLKPLLKLGNGNTFIQNIVVKLTRVCNQVIIVTGFKNNEIEENLKSIEEKEKIKFVFNDKYKSGMFTSLQKGLSTADSKWYLYHFIDQPSLPLNFYSDFVHQIDDKFNWVQPTHNGKKGHPILFDDFVKQRIIKSGIKDTLRDVAQDKSIKKKFWECNTNLIFQDIDTLSDFREM
ncbi:MAG: NTP transferase domain-containing protein [Melioribacteraceae bacterium]|nr:NTP transferase domain-containing protein [Melioribacteraceae bacterium]